MIFTAFALGLIGLASASPATLSKATDNYPKASVSKGFRLVVNVTDPCADFTPSIQNNFVSTIHTGAGLAAAALSPKTGPIFYRNGTTNEIRQDKGNVLSDSGNPAVPMGLQLTSHGKGTTTNDATLNVGYGTQGVGLSSASEGYSFLSPETFVACNSTLTYYPETYFMLLMQDAFTVDKTGAIKTDLPKGCAPIRLIPECAELAELPKNSLASHEFAVDSPCYHDVSAIDWSE